ncbi:hypothetical protein [Luteolibacter sp. Populi]|uniref:hypothetical protein n=1 Tax=Luteolibacter sp. Populi TaxID=3230487 RepID=UPI00346740B4
MNYDTAWLAVAIRRAASAADRHDFPFVDEIRLGIENYLETKCPLTLLPLPDLFERVRHMLVRIGCETIAEKLEALAPPVPLSLVRLAKEAGNGFELAFFRLVKEELDELHAVGAEEIRFGGLKEAAQVLCNTDKWDGRCDAVLADIRNFLDELDRDRNPLRRPMRFRMDAER